MSLALATRPPLAQKEVTLGRVIAWFEILEIGEIDETVFFTASHNKLGKRIEGLGERSAVHPMNLQPTSNFMLVFIGIDA